ncbi:Hypothetical protein DEACI_3718, partial [Acididesulfobacillus acetoxydans]
MLREYWRTGEGVFRRRRQRYIK